MKKHLIGFIGCLLSGMLFGQQLEEFFDEHGLQGTLKYRGERSDTLLPKDGDFELSWRSMSGDSVHTYYAKGQLARHAPNGQWQWREGWWQYAVRPGSNVEPQFNAFGKRVTWQTNFRSGKPDGPFAIDVEQINEQGETKPGVFSLRANFKAGVLQKKIEIADKRVAGVEITCELPVNDSGEAHGKWEFRYPDPDQPGEMITEARYYHNGLLYRIKTEAKGNSMNYVLERESQFVSNEKSGVKNTPLRRGDHAFDEDGESDYSQELLADYVNRFLTRGWSHALFPFYPEIRGAVFRKLQLPLTDNEEVLLAEMEQRSDSLKIQIAERLSLRNIKLNRGRTPALDVALAYLVEANLLLEKTDSLQRRVKEPLFTYCNRYGDDVRHWADTLNAPGFVHGAVYDSVSVELPKIKLEEDSILLIQSMSQLMRELESELPSYYETIDLAYDAIIKEGEIAALSDMLSEKVEQLESKYSDLKGMGEHVRIQWVEEHLTDELQRFVQEENYQQAMKYGNQIHEKMDFLLQWAPHWSEMDSMIIRLKEQYRYFVYNPYTGEHDIEMPVKRRFFNAVQERMWPHVYDLLLRADEWDEWVEQIQLTRDTFSNLMLFAAEEDRSAYRLDRRIRRENNPERMVRMLNNYMEGR